VTCQNPTAIEAAIQNIKVANKVLATYFDAKQYSATGQMAYVTDFSAAMSVGSLGQLRQFNIGQSNANYESSNLYDIPFKQPEKFTTFLITREEDSMASVSLIGYVRFQYVQSSYMRTEHFKKPTIASLLWVIGGFLSLVTRLANLMLARYQSFTIDKSMLKKVYSMRSEQADPKVSQEKPARSKN